MPGDFSYRILSFMNRKTDLPIIKEDELMASFYLFGKDHKVNDELEIINVKDIARKTMEQLARQVRHYSCNPIRMNQKLLKENFNRRSLQILVDSNNKKLNFDINKRISKDPTVLSECYAWHLAYYKCDYFFKLFNPLRSINLPTDLVEKLEGRMILLGFNVKNSMMLPYGDLLEPFLYWLKDTS